MKNSISELTKNHEREVRLLNEKHDRLESAFSKLKDDYGELKKTKENQKMNINLNKFKTDFKVHKLAGKMLIPNMVKASPKLIKYDSITENLVPDETDPLIIIDELKSKLEKNSHKYENIKSALKTILKENEEHQETIEEKNNDLEELNLEISTLREAASEW